MDAPETCTDSITGNVPKPKLCMMQVKEVRALLPSSARKDGIALEEQLAHFQQLLEEGGDAEAAYLAEQLLVGQLHYLVSM